MIYERKTFGYVEEVTAEEWCNDKREAVAASVRGKLTAEIRSRGMEPVGEMRQGPIQGLCDSGGHRLEWRDEIICDPAHTIAYRVPFQLDAVTPLRMNIPPATYLEATS